MRGEDLSFLFPTRFPIRNTPTCVGKTQLWPRASAGSEKHPHMRGEDCLLLISDKCVPETPPHAWGRLPLPCVPFINDRNTPTCVGKTFLLLRTVLVHQKHPHMRGEDTSGRLEAHPQEETPPHAWGRLRRITRAMIRRRNTPTCVGKTAVKLPTSFVPRKHPHMRGEDT